MTTEDIIKKKIAVFCDSQEEICSVYEGEFLQLYQWLAEEQCWEIEETISLDIAPTEEIAKLKPLAQYLMSLMKDYKIIIAKGFTGIFFQLFSKEGFYIFETDMISPEILSEVYEEVFEVKKILEQNKQSPIAPVETEVAGYFAMDMIQLGKEHPEISSKKALLPFFEQGEFLELALICAHTPPWLLERSDLKVKELKSGEQVLAIVNKGNL